MSGTKVPRDRSLIWSSPKRKNSSSRRPGSLVPETGSTPFPIAVTTRPSLMRIPIRSKSVPTLRSGGQKRNSVAHVPFNEGEVGLLKPDWRHYASTDELRARQGSVAVAFTVFHDWDQLKAEEAARFRKQSFSSGPPPLRTSFSGNPSQRPSISNNPSQRRSVSESSSPQRRSLP